MKKILVALLLLIPLWPQGQECIHYEFTSGNNDSQLKKSMEQNTARILTAINKAKGSDSPINHTEIQIDSMTFGRIDRLWKGFRFRVQDDEIVERCLPVKTSDGSILYYQVRGIEAEATFPTGGKRGCGLSLSYDTDSTITNLCLMLPESIYRTCINMREHPDEFDRRMQILRWIEQYVSAHYSKDTLFLEEVYKEQYNPLHDDRKASYLTHLQRVFRNGEAVDITIEEIKIERHPVKSGYYGVTMKHKWENAHDSDGGYTSMIWTFDNERQPKNIRTIVQPSDIDPNQVYTLSNFKL